MSDEELCFTPASELAALIKARAVSPVEAVRAVVRENLPVSYAEQTEAVVQADLSRPNSLAGVCEGIDVVFSCAGQSVSPRPKNSRASFTGVDYRPANCSAYLACSPRRTWA